MPSKLLALALLASMEISSSFVVPINIGDRPGHLQSSRSPVFQTLFSSTVNSNVPPKLSRQVRDLHRDANVIFSIIDVDENGSISRQELTDHLSAAGYGEGVIDKLFANMDKNQDDSISPEEFREGFETMPKLQGLPGFQSLFSSRVDSTSNAPQMLSREVRSLHRDANDVFSIIDVDGNGSISREELTDHLSAAGYGEAVIDKFFANMDKNEDDSISPEEFREGFEAMPELRSLPGFQSLFFSTRVDSNVPETLSRRVLSLHRDANVMFSIVDVDGNGSISREELMAHLSAAGYGEAVIDQLFASMDKNKDDSISPEEFQDGFEFMCTMLESGWPL